VSGLHARLLGAMESGSAIGRFRRWARPGPNRCSLTCCCTTTRRSRGRAWRFCCGPTPPRTLQWRPGAPLWLDVEHFQRALADGRLEEAVETYAGELLEGRYDEWIADERDRLARLHLEALGQLARQHELSQRWPSHGRRGCAGVRVLPRRGPAPPEYVIGQRPAR
jgi:hypothetical protein